MYKDFDAFASAAGLPVTKELPAYPFRNAPQLVRDEDTGLFIPAISGAAEEQENPAGTIGPITPASAAAVPALQRLQLTSKTLLRRLTLQFSGQWDQSVGVETQATEGNPVLLAEIRLNCDGRILRRWSGPVLAQMNKFIVGGANPQVDPAAAVANGKVFSSTLFMGMGFLDTAEPDAREDTYLDLSQYANVFVEVQFNAFNTYASGNTQANISYSVVVTSLEVIGPRRLPQRHFEMLQVQTVDMTVTGSDRLIPLIRSKTIIRGILLRVGTFSATPIATAITALVKVGISGKLNKGATVFPKLKQPVSYYQAAVGYERNNISLTAGYLWIDFASNRSWRGCVAGDAYSDLNLVLDSTGTANTTMQVFQACVVR